MDFNEDNSGFMDKIKGFNQGFDDFQSFSTTMLMIVLSILQGFGQPLALVIVAIVEHHRIQESIISFLEPDIAFLGAFFFMFALVIIPVNSVFSKIRNNQLSFEEKEELEYTGFTLVKFIRWLRYFFGLWDAFSIGNLKFTSLEVEKSKIVKTTWLEWLERILIVTASMLSFFSSISGIDGLVSSGDNEVWYVALTNVFSTTNLSLFMPAMSASFFTLVTTIALTTISREIALTVGEQLMKIKDEEKEKQLKIKLAIVEQEKVKEELALAEKENKIVNILSASAYGRAWTNLQNFVNIDIENDLVDMTDENYRFFDSNLDLWLPKIFDTKTKLRAAISKQMEIRNEVSE